MFRFLVKTALIISLSYSTGSAFKYHYDSVMWTLLFALVLCFVLYVKDIYPD